SRRRSVLLPEPLGPSTSVKDPRSIVRSTSPTSRVPLRTTSAMRQRMGKPWISTITDKCPTSNERGGCVQDKYDRDEHDAERERERQIALARLESDRSRHHARDAIDVAADDHHRADLRNRAPESCKQYGRKRKPGVPQQREGGAPCA